MANIEEKVEALVSKTINDLGYELYDVIYEKEAQDYYLRIFIDTPNGISLEDCEKVNDAITDMLDEANYIKEQYFLEVSSPGIERALRKKKHFEQSIGKEISCNLYKPLTIEEKLEGDIELKKNEAQNIENNSIIEDDEGFEKINIEDQNNEQSKLIKRKKNNKKQKKQSFKKIDGILKDFDEKKITLETELDGNLITITIDKKNISSMKLKYNWE